MVIPLSMAPTALSRTIPARASPDGTITVDTGRESESDTPREAGGLSSWAASKAVGLWVKASRDARLIGQFRIVRLLHPLHPAHGCKCGPAPVRTRRLIPRSRGPRSVRP